MGGFLTSASPPKRGACFLHISFKIQELVNISRISSSLGGACSAYKLGMQQHALGASVIYKLTNLMQKLFNAKVIYGWYCHLGSNRPANPLITVQCTWDKGKNKPEKVQGCRSDLVASFVSSWSHFYHLPETSLVIASFIASSSSL